MEKKTCKNNCKYMEQCEIECADVICHNKSAIEKFLKEESVYTEKEIEEQANDHEEGLPIFDVFDLNGVECEFYEKAEEKSAEVLELEGIIQEYDDEVLIDNLLAWHKFKIKALLKKNKCIVLGDNNLWYGCGKDPEQVLKEVLKCLEEKVFADNTPKKLFVYAVKELKVINL